MSARHIPRGTPLVKLGPSFEALAVGMRERFRVNSDTVKMRVRRPAARATLAPAPCKKRKERGTPGLICERFLKV